VFLILFQVEEMVVLNLLLLKEVDKVNNIVSIILLNHLFIYYHYCYILLDSCQACNGCWTEVTIENNVTVHGKQWCYEGSHSLTETPRHDLRIVRNDEVNIKDGPNLQADIDSLPLNHSTVKKLTIHAVEYDEESRYSFDVVLPELGNQLIFYSFLYQ